MAAWPTERLDLTPEDKARVEAITRPAIDFSKPEAFELMQGGAGTSRKRINRDAFSQSSANITFEEEGPSRLGNALFRKLWVSSPSSTQASDGLGPLFNARACQSCHLKDGRGHPPEGNPGRDFHVPASRACSGDGGGKRLVSERAVRNFPDPVYGTQLQDLAVPGLAGEGRMAIAYEEIAVRLGDGTTVSLSKPAYSVEDLGYGPIDPRTTLSPRVTPQMIGLGLVEQIHPADILAKADPDDADGDGISGRVSTVRDPKSGALTLGRFGWKAQTTTIRQQTADAFAGDIGISDAGHAEILGRLHTGANRLPRSTHRRSGAAWRHRSAGSCA